MAVGSTEAIFIAAALCGIIALFVHHLGRRRFYMAAAKFPGPRTLPLIGNAHYFIGNSQDVMDEGAKLLEKYSGPFRLWFGHRLMIIITDPDHVKTILHSPHTVDRGLVYSFIRPWLGMGLLTSEASTWRIHRKLIAPTFNSRALETFVETFARQAIVTTRRMEKESGVGEFAVHHYLAPYFIDILCATVMGFKFECQEDYSRMADAVCRISQAMSERFFNIWQHPDIIFGLTKAGRDQRELLEYLHGVANDFILMKRNYHNNETAETNRTKYIQPAGKNGFVDLIMRLSTNDGKLTDEEFREEIQTMLVTGFHTNTALTTFAVLMLANHPEIQDRVYRELCDIYGDQVSSESPVKYEDLNRMEYLETVLKETLRLFPIVPTIFRDITEDLDIGDYTLPKGGTVGIVLLSIHRSEKYWPDPLKFDPDRFLPEEVAKRHPYCYLPFSGGPRNCIGQKYAMLAMKVLLATVLRRYVMETKTVLHIKDIKMKADILKPPENITIKISERVSGGVKK